MNTFARRSVAVAVSAAALTMILSSSLPLGAQEPRAPQTESKTKTKTSKKAYDPARRVPAYFGQLALSEDQRESIYKIQGKQMPKIEALQNQIQELREQMVRECEGVLTPAQKQLLEQRRTAGAETRSRRSAAPKSQP